MIRKGDRVMHRDGRTGRAVTDQYLAFSGDQAALIKWDGSTRPAVPNQVRKLVKVIEETP